MSFRGSMMFPSDLMGVAGRGDHSQQLIRVRRRRGGITAASIRLGGNVFNASITAEEGHHDKFSTRAPVSEVLFRRIVQDNEMQNSIRTKKRQVIDAVILVEGEGDQPRKGKKRTKLTLQLVASSTPVGSCDVSQRPRSHSNADHVEAEVEESLLLVIEGHRPAQDHLTLLERIGNPYWHILCCQENGNWLHACAMWNEVNVVREQISRGAYEESTTQILSKLMKAINGEGKTPLQVATASGNHEIAKVLQEFAAQQELIQYSYDDDQDYEYDLYCFDDNNGSCASVQLQDAIEGEEKVLDCELSSEDFSWCTASCLFGSYSGSLSSHHRFSATVGLEQALPDLFQTKEEPSARESTESCTEMDDSGHW